MNCASEDLFAIAAMSDSAAINIYMCKLIDCCEKTDLGPTNRNLSSFFFFFSVECFMAVPLLQFVNVFIELVSLLSTWVCCISY